MDQQLTKLIKEAKMKNACLGAINKIAKCKDVHDALGKLHSSDTAWAFLFLDLPEDLASEFLQMVTNDGAEDILDYVYRSQHRADPTKEIPETSFEKREVLIGFLSPRDAEHLLNIYDAIPSEDEELLVRVAQEE